MYKYLLVGLLTCSIARAGTLPVLTLDNLLQECVNVTLSTPYAVNGKAYVDGEMQVLKSTGYCGCTSMISAYSLVKEDGTVLSHSRFDLTQSGKKKFNIGPTSRLAKLGEPKLRISCAGPE